MWPTSGEQWRGTKRIFPICVKQVLLGMEVLSIDRTIMTSLGGYPDWCKFWNNTESACRHENKHSSSKNSVGSTFSLLFQCTYVAACCIQTVQTICVFIVGGEVERELFGFTCLWKCQNNTRASQVKVHIQITCQTARPYLKHKLLLFTVWNNNLFHST